MKIGQEGKFISFEQNENKVKCLSCASLEVEKLKSDDVIIYKCLACGELDLH